MEGPTDMALEITHLCRREAKCSARRRGKDNEWIAAGTEKPNSLCRACEDAAFDDMSQLHVDWRRMYIELVEQHSSPIQSKIRKTAGNPIPIPLAIDALMTEIETETHRWARIVTQGDEIPWGREDAVRHCVSVLWSRKGTLVDLPARTVCVNVPLPLGGDKIVESIRDGVDAVIALSRLHRATESLLQIGEARVWMTDPCPHCGRKALVASKDQQQVSCRGCSRVWDKDHFKLFGDVLDFDRQLVKA